MRKLLLKFIRLYFRYFPIRKGKIPVLLLVDKTGLTKNVNLVTHYDKDVLINVNLDDWIQKQVFYFGRYEIEKHETLFWQNLIKENQNVLDIGANIGYYSLMASVRVLENGKIFAFEPVTSTFQKLLDNIKINNFKNIITEKLAVSNSLGEIELYIADEKSIGSTSISPHVNYSGIKEKVKTITIDQYFSNNQINKLDVVKIDVEGCEPMVIEGMKNVMSQMKPLILIEVLDERLNTIGSSKELLYKLFEDLNYQPYEIVGWNTLKAIHEPQEGPLVVFKNKDSQFLPHINVI